MNSNLKNARKQDNIFLSSIISNRNKVYEDIVNAKEPEYLLDLPILVSDDDAVLNMLLADAGMGKSLLERCIVGSVIDDDRFVVIYFDLEYISAVAKQRKFDELLTRENFFLVRPMDIDDLRSKTTLKTTARIVYRILKEFTEHYTNKKFLVIIDSFEDLVEDTSNDTELKRVLYDLLSLKRITYLIAHHISKGGVLNKAMLFRGSMVIKAKVSSMLYLTKRTKENDFEELFELDILKIRSMYKSVNKISVRLNFNEFKVKDILIATNTEEIKVLKEAYFLLRREGTLTKTNLIKMLAESLQKNKDKIRDIIDSHLDMFDIKKGERRTEYFSLTTNKEILDSYLAKLGLGDSSLSDVKVNLLRELENIDDNEELNIEVKDERDTLIVYKYKKTIVSNIYRMSDFVASEILEKLRVLKLQNLEDDLYDLVDF